MPLPIIDADKARELVDRGATLVDIREPDEYAREHIPGARNVPVGRLADLPPGSLVFHCRSGARTSANQNILFSASRGAPCHILGGGLDAWRRAGLPLRLDRRQPLEIMRQVQLVAGGLVLAGIALGLTVSPAFLGISAFVGGGLMAAGATGWCGMARLLGHMPWNRAARSG